MPGYNGHEYSKPSVTSSGCSYATLDAYNQNYFGRGRAGPPMRAQTNSPEVVIVPSFGGMGYANLTNNTAPNCGGRQMSNSAAPSCNGYFDISNAYPNYANTCGRFTSNLC
jgi:hypothetical protein